MSARDMIIMLVSMAIGGTIGIAGVIALAWFTRNIFPTLFVPDDW